MAKEHVFPVCNPGSKLYTAQDKKDGGISIQSGPLVYSETEDPDVLFSENVNGNHYNAQILTLREDKSEYLIDHTGAPETNLVVVNGQEYVAPFFPYQEQNNTSYFALWRSINNKSKQDFIIPPGHVVCIGRKKNSDVAWSDRTALWLGVYLGSNDPQNNTPFFGSSPIINDLDYANIKDGEWATYMWNGTRFVFLGSNNWF